MSNHSATSTQNEPFSQVNIEKDYWNIALHSVITSMGQSLMQVVDLLFCRDLGPVASATVGTATTLFAWFLIIGLGLIISLEYLIPHALGEDDEKKAQSFYYSGIAVGTLVGIISAAGLAIMGNALGIFGVNPALHENVKWFSYITALSYIPVFLVPVMRVELQARGRPHDVTYAFVFANLLNIVLNWAFIFGHLGVPAMGVMGSAWANLICRFALLFFAMARVNAIRSKLSYVLGWANAAYRDCIKKIVTMGAPTSFHLLFEMGAFAFAGTLAARLSATENAAHAIAISLASFVFMIPMGLGSAAALTMGRANGEANPELASKLGRRTLRLGLVYAAIGSCLIMVFRVQLTQLYTSDSETIGVGAALLFITALFQFGDAMQVILAGCIRGFGETSIQAKVNAIGHWCLGIPLGLYLCFSKGMGVRGIWTGLSLGLFAVAFGLFVSWRRLERKRILS